MTRWKLLPTLSLMLLIPAQVHSQSPCSDWHSTSFWELAAPSLLQACLSDSIIQVDEQHPTSGGTPLHYAVAYGSPAVVSALLDAGADIEAPDSDGDTPLHWADTAEAVQVLLDADAPIEAQNADGRTPLYAAVINNHGPVVNALLNHRANPAARDTTGLTPLHWAGHPNTVEALLSAGADIEARDNFGSTPLHVAALNRKVMAVAALVSAGARIDARNTDGDSPMHIAARNGSRDMVEVLLEGGADPAARDRNGQIPFDSASDSLRGTDVWWRLHEGQFLACPRRTE